MIANAVGWALHGEDGAERVVVDGDRLDVVERVAERVHTQLLQWLDVEGDVEVRDWIAYGVERGWATEACSTHDGVPMTDDEEDDWGDGLDPCLHVLRLWPDGKPPEG